MWGRQPCWVAGRAARWVGAEGPALNYVGHAGDCSLVLILESGPARRGEDHGNDDAPDFTQGKKHRW